MQLHAAVVRVRLGELAGSGRDLEVAQRAHAWMVEQEIARPDRIGAMFAMPGGAPADPGRADDSARWSKRAAWPFASTPRTSAASTSRDARASTARSRSATWRAESRGSSSGSAVTSSACSTWARARGSGARGFARTCPAVRYRSVDVSEYACETYGHELRDISRWKAREKFDLLVCQGVLPYLDDEACGRAITNMAAMCRGFLYLEAITGARSARGLRPYAHGRPRPRSARGLLSPRAGEAVRAARLRPLPRARRRQALLRARARLMSWALRTTVYPGVARRDELRRVG